MAQASKLKRIYGIRNGGDRKSDGTKFPLKTQVLLRLLSKKQKQKLKPVIAEKAKKRQASTQFGGEGNISLTKGQTRDVMGEKVGVSGKTYDKMKAIDESDNEEVKQAVRNKEMSIDNAYRQIKGTCQICRLQPQATGHRIFSNRFGTNTHKNQNTRI